MLQSHSSEQVKTSNSTKGPTKYPKRRRRLSVRDFCDPKTMSQKILLGPIEPSALRIWVGSLFAIPLWCTRSSLPLPPLLLGAPRWFLWPQAMTLCFSQILRPHQRVFAPLQFGQLVLHCLPLSQIRHPAVAIPHTRKTAHTLVWLCQQLRPKRSKANTLPSVESRSRIPAKTTKMW